MKKTRIIMGMPVIVEVVDKDATSDIFKEVFEYFRSVDNRFSTYKSESEISQINKGLIDKSSYSGEMKEIFDLAEKTKSESDGYFDINFKGQIDPSGIVKGWAIRNAASIIKNKGFKNYYVGAGGDIQMEGQNSNGENWRVGIKNPFKLTEIVKVLSLTDCGVATSGTYERGQHIYNPKTGEREITDVASITVIGPDIYEADRFATAAFAMGKKGIEFIERLSGFEGYMIDSMKVATKTSRFEKYELN